MSGRCQAKKVTEGLNCYGPGIRIYFGEDGDELVILLGGGTKKMQRKDIKEAQMLWTQYKKEKKLKK